MFLGAEREASEKLVTGWKCCFRKENLWRVWESILLKSGDCTAPSCDFPWHVQVQNTKMLLFCLCAMLIVSIHAALSSLLWIYPLSFLVLLIPFAKCRTKIFNLFQKIKASILVTLLDIWFFYKQISTDIATQLLVFHMLSSLCGSPRVSSLQL